MISSGKPNKKRRLLFFLPQSIPCLLQLYKYIHKQHHEWTAPVGFTALYAHPVEHIISNIGPLVLGPIICGSHLATSWLWLSMAILNALNSHSGYHFPFFPSPEAHDFHHLRFNQCFGVLGILDYLHGTDDMFRSSKVIYPPPISSGIFTDHKNKKCYLSSLKYGLLDSYQLASA